MSGGSPARLLRDVARAGVIMAAGLMILSGAARAQIVLDAPTQAELLKLPADQQGAQLADVVRRASPNRRCSQARVSLDRTLNDGSGGWLVQCEEGQDYFVMLPGQPKRAATALPCILARTTAGTDCYANFRTVLPEHSEQCARSPFPDRVISACTAIIQSGRLADKPTGLAIAYQSRASAFLRYQQVDLALADLDRAVALTPSDAYALYNRAVALERKGDFDQAIRDLNEVVRLKPDHPFAHFERGYLFLRRGEHDRAIGDLDQFIAVHPTDAKAYRIRSAVYEAKGDAAKADADMKKAREIDPSIQPLVLASPTPPPPASTLAAAVLGDADRDAAYCMQASGGQVGMYNRMIGTIRDRIKTTEAMRERPNLPAESKDQIAAGLRTLNERLADTEAKKTHWNGLATTYLDYLKRHGLLQPGKVDLVSAIANEARKDQQALIDDFAACQRLCKPDDAACKSACDGKLTTSDATKRLLRCEQVAVGFK